MDNKDIYRKIDKFHAHLDVCSQCRNHPFYLCPTGAKLLKDAATAGEAGEKERDTSLDRHFNLR